MAMKSLDVQTDYSQMADTDYCACPTIYLTEAQCAALGIQGSIDAGTVIGFNARAVVVRSTSSVADEDDDPQYCVSLQITDAEIVAPPSGSDASKLYGNS